MNQDNFFKVCTTPAQKTLIGGSSGSGKSSIVLDITVKFLHEHYRKDLDISEMNELHSVLNDQVPVVILTEGDRYRLLSNLSDNCFPGSELSDTDKMARVDNLCKIYSPVDSDLTDDWLFTFEENLRRRQTKLLIIDATLFNLNPALLLKWAREFNMAIVQTVQNYRSAPGYVNKRQFSGPISHMQTSDLAVMLSEPVKKSNNYLKFEVTIMKNRFGSIMDKDFVYECTYTPY